ncbi:hypothetical protein XELAEV_18026017mg [Xenopus laevis]|uniref:Uncharacterized protein n=1 Tax=Xenopus laevis TaxID=8355 RepID=A0A974D3F6_XENLA|nr:hypothetical protein XELAEV_18026017mg [Xenopus laevis]
MSRYLPYWATPGPMLVSHEGPCRSSCEDFIHDLMQPSPMGFYSFSYQYPFKTSQVLNGEVIIFSSCSIAHASLQPCMLPCNRET